MTNVTKRKLIVISIQSVSLIKLISTIFFCTKITSRKPCRVPLNKDHSKTCYSAAKQKFSENFQQQGPMKGRTLRKCFSWKNNIKMTGKQSIYKVKTLKNRKMLTLRRYWHHLNDYDLTILRIKICIIVVKWRILTKKYNFVADYFWVNLLLV